MKLEYHPYKAILQFDLIYRAALETYHLLFNADTLYVDVMPHAY